MKQPFNVAELVPHTGSMSLLDEIIDYGDDWLSAVVVIRPDSMFCDGNAVPGWLGLEYMAQSIAAFAGLQERLNGGEPQLGFLVGTRRYTSNSPSFETGQRLLLMVRQILKADNGLSVFECQIDGEGISVEASLNVYQPDDARRYIQDAMQ